jgi:hypothetical protein
MFVWAKETREDNFRYRGVSGTPQSSLAELVSCCRTSALKKNYEMKNKKTDGELSSFGYYDRWQEKAG